jgi:hypothetical protein
MTMGAGQVRVSVSTWAEADFASDCIHHTVPNGITQSELERDVSGTKQEAGSGSREDHFWHPWRAFLALSCFRPGNFGQVWLGIDTTNLHPCVPGFPT